ncbi:MAG TPA: hypothetical protein VKA83_09370 [Methylomirabilota bacterium]|nr:hypothetical protein [Methylomirabilota bacterium]
MKLILLAVAVLVVLWAGIVFAQKDQMHMGESLGGRVIRKADQGPDPLHSQPGAKTATGELKVQRQPAHNPDPAKAKGIQTK